MWAFPLWKNLSPDISLIAKRNSCSVNLTVRWTRLNAQLHPSQQNANISHDKDCTCPRLIYGHRFYHWNNGSNNTFHNFFCKPSYLTYIAFHTQRKRIEEFPSNEKAVRKRHLFRQDRLKKEAFSSLICISISYTLPNSLDFLIQYLEGHLNSELPFLSLFHYLT